jgi:hypothetical protein
MGQLCTLFATRDWPDGQITDRVFAWEGDVSARAASVPLRIAGALHALVLNGHTGLTTVYPPYNPDDDTLWTAVSEALVTDAAFIDDWINSPPQTNEVRRSAALIPAGHWLADRYGLPIDVMELGASAGLNLMWDQFSIEIAGQAFGPTSPALTLKPEWDGPLLRNTRPTIASRRGVDLNPLDPNADALRLRAYLWPDQPERRQLTDAAIACNDTSVSRGDAIGWLADNIAPTNGHLRMIYHTIAWQYFPSDIQATGTALIEQAGAEATPLTPLAWFAMEADDNPKGAGLTLRLWPGDIKLAMGRADFHGRWITWHPPLLSGETSTC